MTLPRSFQNLSKVEQLASCFFILGFILLNVTFWTERWSVSDYEVNTLKSVCFDRGEDTCCQTFEDRHETVPGMLLNHKRRFLSKWLCCATKCWMIETHTVYIWDIKTQIFFI